MDIRSLTMADARASVTASREAFGGPVEDLSTFTVGQGVHRWGVFDGSILAAKASDREYMSLIGGRQVPTAGAAGVVVAPEYRGSGLARAVMTHLLTEARRRGASISTLFRTAPALYRSLGFEQVAELLIGELPVAALRGLRRHPSVTVRRALVSDAPAIRSVYAQIAEQGSCLLTRTGPCFTATDQQLIDSVDGITVAVDIGGQITGYFCWTRGSGVGVDGVLTISEFLALMAPAQESLLAVAGSFDAVTRTVRFRTSGTDP
ncbi:MAG: GNAT family N-acetyltransferase, partial [Nakamurella sp.]